MRLFSCDLCGKSLAPDGEPRFVVRVDGFPAPVDPADATTLEDSDSDAVDAMDELLGEQEDSGSEHDTAEMLPVCAHREYDLCGGCYRKLLDDPLGLASRRQIPVSRN